MRIGFTGAQGTGKTTLLRAVESSGLGFKVVPSTARAAASAGFKINREADPLSQFVTTMSRIDWEDHHYHETAKTVSDRTPLDSLAYTCYQMHNVWNMEKPMQDFYWETSKGVVVKHMWKYDHVFYFPPYWAPKEDGVRDGDVGYQRQFDEILTGLLDQYNIEYHTVPRGDTDKRMSWLTKTLNL